MTDIFDKYGETKRLLALRDAEIVGLARVTLRDRARIAELTAELESTADKLSTCWLFLNFLASQLPAEHCIRERVEEILHKQQCPGWEETRQSRFDALLSRCQRRWVEAKLLAPDDANSHEYPVHPEAQ